MTSIARTLYGASLLSVLLSILTWRTTKEDDAGHAERFGIFIGLWAPTLAIFGKVVEDQGKK